MRRLVALLTLLLVVLVVRGCGDLVTMSGGGEPAFEETSSTFHVEVGDVLTLAYSVEPVGQGSPTVAVSATGPDVEDQLVTVSGAQTSSVSFRCTIAGDYRLRVSGKSATYSLSLAKD